MSLRLNRTAYEKMIEEEFNDLRIDGANSMVIESILKYSVLVHYELMPAIKRVMDIQDCTWKHNVQTDDLVIIREFINREFKAGQ